MSPWKPWSIMFADRFETGSLLTREPHRSVLRPGCNMGRHRLIIGCMALVWMELIWGCLATARAESPTDAVRDTINQVIQILEDKELKKPNKAHDRRRNLENTMAARFDYAEMSKRALAAQWRSLTAEQRNEFVELFKSFLSDRYAEKIEGYAGEEVHYLSERIEGQYAEVRTKLVSQKVQVPIDYRLMKKADTWHAYDIIVDGISLVNNYRSQFTSVIHNTSYANLVRRLRERSPSDESGKSQK